MDGAFVYAVRSTGVYCRPSCPSRRPHRSSGCILSHGKRGPPARFPPLPALLGATGRPRARSLASSLACAALSSGRTRTSNMGATLRSLAAGAGISASRLRHAFQRLMGVTPRGYADQVRLSRLKHRLRKEEDVTTAMYESGYGSPSRLYERSNHQLGMTPATYGRGGRGMEIRYTITPSPIGRILVAGTDRGVSAIYMGRSDAELAATLRREYPEAHIQPQSGERLALGPPDRAPPCRPPSATGFAAGYSGHRVSAAGLGSVAANPLRPDALVHRSGSPIRPTQSAPRRRPRLRHQSRIAGDPVSSRHSGRWRTRRLRRRHRTQTGPAGGREARR